MIANPRLRLFSLAALLIAFVALVAGPTFADKVTHDSQMKLVSPNGKCWIMFVASDTGAAIYLSDNEGREQRHASIVTRGDNSGDPVLSLHRDIRKITGGFDVALSAQKDGGYLQLMQSGKPFIFNGKDLADFKNRAAIGKTKPDDNALIGGCRCSFGGECTCGVTCNCLSPRAGVFDAGAIAKLTR